MSVSDHERRELRGIGSAERRRRARSAARRKRRGQAFVPGDVGPRPRTAKDKAREDKIRRLFQLPSPSIRRRRPRQRPAPKRKFNPFRGGALARRRRS